LVQIAEKIGLLLLLVKLFKKSFSSRNPYYDNLIAMPEPAQFEEFKKLQSSSWSFAGTVSSPGMT